MSSGPQSRDKNFAFPPAPVRGILYSEDWNRTMLAICEELDVLQARDLDYVDAVNVVKNQLLQSISTSLLVPIEEARTVLDQIAAAYAEVMADGIAADKIKISGVQSFPGTDIDAVLRGLAARFNGQRRLNAISYFLGGS